LSYGLRAGVATVFCRLLAHTTEALTSCAYGERAELSRQNASSSRPARSGSPRPSADHASQAHTAPPDVPLSRTMS